MTQIKHPQKANQQVAKKPKADDFESVAKRLECDEDKARFEAKLGKIAKVSRSSAKTGRKVKT